MEKPIKSKGYVAFMDIYGFSYLKHNNNLFLRLIKCHKFVDEEIKNTITKAFYFSDSIFLFYETIDEKNRMKVLRKIKANIENIMGFFINNKFALRGSLGFGNLKYNERLIVGEAAIKAYNNEQKIAIPVFWIPFKELTDEETKSIGKDKKNLVELKSPGYKMYGYRILPHPIDNFITYIKEQREYYLTNGPSEPAMAWDKTYQYINNNF